jgi:hypothetical protein
VRASCAAASLAALALSRQILSRMVVHFSGGATQLAVAPEPAHRRLTVSSNRFARAR